MANTERNEWARVALALAKGHDLSPVQLQKAVFLLQELVPNLIEAEKYTFDPYMYGPFTADVYRDAVALQQEGDVAISSSSEGYRIYRATPSLAESADKLIAKAEKKDREYARNLIAWVERQSFRSLVRAVYEQFPDYRVNSVFE